MKYIRVANCEWHKFLVFSLMIGLITFVYSFMRIIKDMYVIVRQNPICIPYIKLFYILPLNFLFIIVVNVLLTRRTLSKVFTIFIIFYIALFSLFAILVLLEERIFFNPYYIDSWIAVSFLDVRGFGFLKDFLMTINQPLATLIYIGGEMWGAIILTFLFFSFLNESCTRGQHARFLPPLMTVSCLWQILAAMATTGFLNIRSKLSYDSNRYLMATIFLIASFLGLLVLFIKYYFERHVLRVPIFRPRSRSEAAAPVKKKSGSSFSESVEIMTKSRFLLAMCMIIFSYNFTYNVLETVYKNALSKGAVAKKVEKGKYTGKFNNMEQYLSGLTVIFLNFTPFTKLESLMGWRFVALMTPIAVSISSFAILGSAIYNAGTEDGSLTLINKIFGGRRGFIGIENYLGLICVATQKILKLSAFEVSKERVSMRINDEYRPKFKSIFDGIFNKTGKSGGAAFSIIVKTLGASIDLRGMSPIISVVVGLSIVSWMYSVFYIAGSYNKSVAEHNDIDIDLVEDEEGEEQTGEIKKPAPNNPLPAQQ